MQSIDNLIRRAAKDLELADIEEAKREARLILELVSHISPAKQLADPDRLLQDADSGRFIGMVRERALGRPFAYLSGQADFYGRTFLVENCLIPRPETELLVSQVLDLDWPPEPRILDLCTGSGCLGISVYLELVQRAYRPSLVMTDISPKSLASCQKNLDSYIKEPGRASCLEADIFPALTGIAWGKAGFDLILANPPYIKSSDLSGLEKSVRDFEPAEALDGGTDGLDFYRRIADEIKPYLASQGSLLLLEHGAGQRAEILTIFQNSGLNIGKYIVQDDWQGHDRLLGFFL